MTGVDGRAIPVTVNVWVAPVPHVLLAATETVAVPVPAVNAIEEVVLVPLHPVPAIDHV